MNNRQNKPTTELDPTQFITQFTFNRDQYIEDWTLGYLDYLDTENRTPGTIRYYRKEFKLFVEFCSANGLTHMKEIKKEVLRGYDSYLKAKGRNPHGRHAAYRAIRALCYFFEREEEPDDWVNPIRFVKGPQVDDEPIDPITLPEIKQLLAVCDQKSKWGLRDYAIILTLAETGVRANELTRMDIAHIEPGPNRIGILIPKSKNRSPRKVWITKPTWKAIKKYLATRKDNLPCLWINREGERLEYEGLRYVIELKIEKLAKTGVEVDRTLHDFRRYFLKKMIDKGEDPYTVAKVAGHKGIRVLERYVKQSDRDTKRAHMRANPLEDL